MPQHSARISNFGLEFYDIQTTYGKQTAFESGQILPDQGENPYVLLPDNQPQK